MGIVAVMLATLRARAIIYVFSLFISTSHTFPTDSHLQGAGKDSRPTGASVPSEAAPIKLGLHHGVVLGGVDVLLDASCRCVRVVCRAMQCKRARPIFPFFLMTQGLCWRALPRALTTTVRGSYDVINL